MKIALFTDGVWPLIVGGIQKHSYNLCKYLARNGIKVDLYYTSATEFRSFDELFEPSEIANITTHYVPFPTTLKLPGHYVRASIEYSQRILSEYFTNCPADIIYSQGLTGYAAIVQKRKGVLLPPICVNAHGYEFLQKAATLKSRLQQYLLQPPFKVINQNADYVFSFGGKITELIEHNYFIQREKILEVPIGVDDNFLTLHANKTDKKRKFVFLGRYERRKGIEELTEVLLTLLNRNDFEFSFIGNIPFERQLRATQITYHGELKDVEAVKGHLVHSDILVCPSYAEGMPNVILEGMAASCAIIATDVGAVRAMVDRANGWLIEAGSKHALQDALVSAMNIDEQALTCMKENSFYSVKNNFTWNNVIHDIIRLFQTMKRKSSIEIERTNFE